MANVHGSSIYDAHGELIFAKTTSCNRCAKSLRVNKCNMSPSTQNRCLLILGVSHIDVSVDADRFSLTVSENVSMKIE